MCYPMPGPRCASDVRERMESVKSLLDDAYQEENKDSILALKEEIQDLQEEYNATKTGQRELKKQIEEYESSGDWSKAAMAEAALELGIETRDDQMRSLISQQWRDSSRMDGIDQGDIAVDDVDYAEDVTLLDRTDFVDNKIAVDPSDCGCTDCIVGNSIPLNNIDSSKLAALAMEYTSRKREVINRTGYLLEPFNDGNRAGFFIDRDNSKSLTGISAR